MAAARRVGPMFRPALFTAPDEGGSKRPKRRTITRGRLISLSPDYTVLTKRPVKNRISFRGEPRDGHQEGVFVTRWRLSDPLDQIYSGRPDESGQPPIKRRVYAVYGART